MNTRTVTFSRELSKWVTLLDPPRSEQVAERFATPDEEVQLEWSFPPWEVEVVFEPSGEVRMMAGQVNVPPTYSGQLPNKDAHARLNQANISESIAAFLAEVRGL